MSRMKFFLRKIFNVFKWPFFKLANAIEIYFLDRMNPKKITDSERCSGKKVLVLGVYMANKKNFATHLAEEFSQSKIVSVTQAWVAIGEGKPDSDILSDVTHRVITGKVPKFSLLNELLREYDVNDFDYLVVTDDDIIVEKGFIDRYICLQEMLGFSLAQPARTRFSELSHKITKVNTGTIARETRFIEIGPVFSIEKKAFPDLLPFDESSPMGWGYDFVWPSIISEKKLTMGIVDATPVNHSIRPTNQFYSGAVASSQMRDYLSKNKHCSREEAFVVKKYYTAVEELS